MLIDHQIKNKNLQWLLSLHKSNNITLEGLIGKQSTSESIQEIMTQNSIYEPNLTLSRRNIEDRTVTPVVHHSSGRARSLKNTFR